MYVTGKNVLDAPERDVTLIEVPGRNGDILSDNGRFKNLPCTYTVFTRNRPVERSRAIKGWLLSNPGYRRLEDTYDPDYFRMAYYIGPVNIERQAQKYGSADIIFQCKPQRYRKDGEKIMRISGNEKPVLVYNPELFASSPKIRLIGSGNATLTIGSDSWNFSEVDEYIDVDSEMMNAYKGAEPQNAKMAGDGFPRLKPGENYILVSPQTFMVEIMPRWWTV